MRLLIVLILSTFLTLCHTQPAYSETLSLINGAWSHHVSSNGFKRDGKFTEYNEEHEAYGLRYGPHSIFTFINSYHTRGYAYTHTWDTCETFSFLEFCLAGTAGVTTGYKDALDHYLLPVLGGGGALSVDGIKLNIMYIPLADVMTYQLETELFEL